MNNKVSSILEKALQDKAKGNYQKALRRLADALDKHPDEVELYLEAADVCLEGGESLQATQFFKKAYAKFSAEKERIDNFAREKLRTLCDPVLGKFLLDLSIKRRDPEGATGMLDDLQDRTIRELLQRTRTKKRTLSSAASGGHALKSEMVVNVMSEALLCLRLGRIKESVRAFLEILDDKPVENEVLEPFFAGLEKKHPKVGRIRFAYGCSLIYAQQYDKAMSRLVLGAKLEPKIAEEALIRLRNLTEKFETPPESLQDALVEILLIKGDVLRAAEILEETLTDNPDKAKWVMELMWPYVEEVSDSLVLHYLYMDAALVAEQNKRVLQMLRLIRKSDAHKDDVYEWVDNKASEQFLPAELMLAHGEMALEADKFDRAIEIFKALVGSSPNDAPTVLNLVEKRKDDDPSLAEFFDELASKERSDAPSSEGGADFEHFENNEFKFSSGSSGELEIEQEESPEAAATTADEPKPSESDTASPRFDSSPFAGERKLFGEGEEAETDTETDEARSPLEIGLEQAAQTAAKGAPEGIVWEEEDASGSVEPGNESPGTSDDDSWLEKQSSSVMGRSGAQTEPPGLDGLAQEEPPEEPPSESPLSDFAEDQRIEDEDVLEESEKPEETVIEVEADATAEAEIPEVEAEGTKAEGTEAESVEVEASPSGETEILEGDTEVGAELGTLVEADATAEAEIPEVEAEGTKSEGAEKTPDEDTEGADTGYDIDELSVTAYANTLRDAGARLFFHVDDRTQAQTPAEIETEVEADASATGTEAEGTESAERVVEEEALEEPEEREETEVEVEADASAEAEIPEASAEGTEAESTETVEDFDPDDDIQDAAPLDVPERVPVEVYTGDDSRGAGTSDGAFEALFETFLDGELENSAIIELAAEALETDRWDEARELLYFDPRDETEEIARKRLQVDYYLAIDRPTTARDVVDTIDIASLADEQLCEFLLRKAACYEQTNEAAKATKIFKRIMSEFPKSDAERIAKRNLKRMSQKQSGGALVLEKTTSLNDE